jgi:hypothetical protein
METLLFCEEKRGRVFGCRPRSGLAQSGVYAATVNLSLDAMVHLIVWQHTLIDIRVVPRPHVLFPTVREAEADACE